MRESSAKPGLARAHSASAASMARGFRMNDLSSGDSVAALWLRVQPIEREDRAPDVGVVELGIVGGRDALAIECDGGSTERCEARPVVNARLQQQVPLGAW